MKMTKKMTEVYTYNIAVSDEERRTIMDALATTIDYNSGTVMCRELFEGLKAANATTE